MRTARGVAVLTVIGCSAERTLTLGPEHFNRLQPIPIVPLAIQAGSHLPLDPDPAWNEVQAVTPYILQGAPTPANPSSGFTLTSRDRQGAVTGSAGTSETLVHIDHGAEPMLVSGKVAADKLHEIDLTLGGTTIAQDTASPNAPTVSIRKSLSGRTLGGRHGAVLRWSARDADGNALTAAVDYSPNGGHSWHAIYRGENRGSLRLPSRMLSRSANARFRVTVSDGFNAAIVESPSSVPSERRRASRSSVPACAHASRPAARSTWKRPPTRTLATGSAVGRWCGAPAVDAWAPARS